MIGVAIIGTGNISPQHIQGYQRFADRCTIKALVDIVPEKARGKNEEYGVGAQVYGSHKDILHRADIDLVSICTPPYCHASIAIDFLRAGKKVLVEKPMGRLAGGVRRHAPRGGGNGKYAGGHRPEPVPHHGHEPEAPAG